MAKAQTIDEYLDGFTGTGREVLEGLRALAGEVMPSATEATKWNAPAWVRPSGTILFMASGYGRHANIAFTPDTRAAFDAELVGFDIGKGSVKLPYGAAVPEELLRRMMAFRIREHENDGALWM